MPLNKKPKGKKTERILKDFKVNGELYIMAIPAIILLLLFAYLPMGGLIIAFKELDFSKGIFGSPWVKPITGNFDLLFKHNPQAFLAIRNTLFLNALFIIIGTISAVGFALLLNEVKNSLFKKTIQTITFLPYFISTIVVGIFVSQLLNYDSGAVNGLLVKFGVSRVAFYSTPSLWPSILTIASVWKGVGYAAILYLATIAGIDPSYYEAAQIDGATKWQMTRYISLPMLKPTITILTLLSIGRIMNSDFGFFYFITGDVPTLYKATDVIDTFIYRSLRQTGDLGIASATAFFQSMVSFVLVIISNRVARRIDKESALF